MNIPSITTNLIKDKSLNLLSSLANNSDSIAPMLVKDVISNTAIVHTYKKEGGQDDAREKAIEEFGTGAVWLLAIPSIKFILDKVAFKPLKLDPSLDTRLILSSSDKIQKNKTAVSSKNGFFSNLKNKLLSDGIDKETQKELQAKLLKSDNPLHQHEKEVFKSLDKTNEIFSKLPFIKNNAKLKNLTNGQLYKGLFYGKFFTATLLSALALVKIIQFKQKTTQKRIEHDFYKTNASRILLNNSLKVAPTYQSFNGLRKQENKNQNNNGNISFKGGFSNLIRAFAYNPILNTSILDGVITTTRLKEARHGEKKEVFLKELFQIIFIYCLAKPIQKGFEGIGNAIKMPIDLDPKVLFTKDLATKLKEAEKEAKNLDTQKLVQSVYDINPKGALAELLEKNGVITLLKNGNDKAISYMNGVSKADVEKALKGFEKLSQNIGNLKGIKAYKVLSVFGNIAFAAWAMGKLQPRVNIWMRKVLNNGDNRNPAIVAQEKAMMQNKQAQFS